ncbi:ABC transporter ATP-binding protein [Clostridium sp. DL1XJH146]
MELLKVENLTKVIKGKTIVDNISLKVNSGEIVGFLGPNGAGKTTTIKMVMGLFNITEGEISICGKNVKTDFEEAMKDVGAIVENPDLYKEKTGRANLEYYASMYDDVGKKEIDQVVELVKMSDRIDDKVKTYSLGMRQRVGLAQALLHQPKLLVLDEPTNGLDPIGIKEMRDLLKFLAKNSGTGILVSSHLLAEIELMCTKIYVIDNGKFIGERKIGEGSEESNLENFIDYTLTTSDNEKVQEIFKDSDMKCTLVESEVAITIKENETQKMITMINKEGIDIQWITQKKRTLEDEFISITNGTKGQIR